MAQDCKGKQIVSFFKAICDLNRHKILYLVKKNGEMNATEIMHKVGLSQPTVSHHLKILVEAGVLELRREGKEALYKVDEKFISHCCLGFAKGFCSGKDQG